MNEERFKKEMCNYVKEIMEFKKDVFCKDCKWLSNFCDVIGLTKKQSVSKGDKIYDTAWRCIHENNIEHSTEVTWFEKVDNSKYKIKPEEINKNNDCKWFEQKEDDEKK